MQKAGAGGRQKQAKAGGESRMSLRLGMTQWLGRAQWIGWTQWLGRNQWLGRRHEKAGGRRQE
jgi:hypothetical protein